MDSTLVYDCNGDSMTMKQDKGTHWLWALLCMTLGGELSISKTKLHAMLELVGCEHFNDQPSPRVINTHLNYCDLPQDIKQKKCKVVLLMRNPKDVALSNYFFVSSLRGLDYNGTLGGFLGMFHEGKVPFGRFFDYVKEWGDVIKSGGPNPIHVLYYENLKRNFVPTMSKLGEFIERKRSMEFYSQLQEYTNFDHFKLLNERISTEQNKSIWKSKPGFIRKGVIGDWKNWFTVAQNEQFENAFKDHHIVECFPFEYV